MALGHQLFPILVKEFNAQQLWRQMLGGFQFSLQKSQKVFAKTDTWDLPSENAWKMETGVQSKILACLSHSAQPKISTEPLGIKPWLGHPLLVGVILATQDLQEETVLLMVLGQPAFLLFVKEIFAVLLVKEEPSGLDHCL